MYQFIDHTASYYYVGYIKLFINTFFEKIGFTHSLEEQMTKNNNKIHEMVKCWDWDEEAFGFVVWIAAGFESSGNKNI